MTRRILVTGGAGFIGSHLCRRLLDDGNEVLCVDNFCTSTRSSLAHLSKHSNFELMRHDVTFPLYVEIDEVYHLACPASPLHYQRDPVQTMKTAVHGSINMLGLAKRTKAKILLTSTSEVYGDPLQHPQSEEYWGHVNPIGPRACYDEGKRAAETLFFDYRRQHGVDTKVVRLFNTYGPGMPHGDGRVVSNFITAALSGKPLTVYGSGTQTRSFCYIDDMVEALLLMMASAADGSGPFNLGNPEERSMIELAEIVLELTGSSSAIEKYPLPADDPGKRCPDISRARAVLGWGPKTGLRDGLRRTIHCAQAVAARPSSP